MDKLSSTLKPENKKGAFDGMIVDLAGFNGVGDGRVGSSSCIFPN